MDHHNKRREKRGIPAPAFVGHHPSLRTRPCPRPVPGSPCAGRGWPKSAGAVPCPGLPWSGHGLSSGGRPLLRAAPCQGPVSVRRRRDRSRPVAAPKCGPPPVPMRPRFCCIRCGRCRLGRGGCRPPETKRHICGLRTRCRAHFLCQTPDAETLYFPVQNAPAYRTSQCVRRCRVRFRLCKAPGR